MYKFGLYFSILIVLLFPGVTLAATTPNFPTCANPSGTLKADHQTGNHGVLGNTGLFSGSDKVFSLGEGNAMQCFCGVDGRAVQTNFWKISDLSDSERKVLESQGWQYISDGSLWGLDAGSYLGKNVGYACSGGSSDGGSSSSSSSGSSSSDSSGFTGASGSVAGISTFRGAVGEVLGLASTGSLQIILGLISLGIGFMISGILVGLARKK